MKSEFTDLRRSQLDRRLAAFETARQEVRPPRGWLRAIREGLGLSLAEVGKRAGESRQHIERFEAAEAKDTIHLRNLRRIAGAMDCELVYAIVPKSGTLSELAEKIERDETTEKVRRVARTMALEGQSTGNTEQFVESKIKNHRRR
jgi:predicted DNA-binding mobile mystery protein A